MADGVTSAPKAAGGSQRTGLRPRKGSAPLTLYFDTSALIKLVISEPGSGLAQELWAGRYKKASSVLIYPEGMAALAAARRGARLSQRLYRQATESFAQSYKDLVAIGVDERLTLEAGTLAADLALRGYDAVHLASVLTIGETDVAMVTWDRDLARAASEAGIPVLTE